MRGTKHNFATAYIKHEIEDCLYRTASTYLNWKHVNGSIVTGPNAIRHIHNFRKYIGRGTLTICEIDAETIQRIKRRADWVPGVKILHDSIANHVARFTDADLTCRSDLKAIIATLQNQASCFNDRPKAFIFSYGCRSSVKSTEETKLLPTVNSVLKYIGVETISFRSETVRCVNPQAWSHEVHFSIPVTGDRLLRLRCFKYNAGGGPMVTCLICYK